MCLSTATFVEEHEMLSAPRTTSEAQERRTGADVRAGRNTVKQLQRLTMMTEDDAKRA